MENLENVSTHEKDQMLDWLLYHLSLETRQKLMAEMPIAYSHVFPNVIKAYVVDKVAERLATE